MLLASSPRLRFGLLTEPQNSGFPCGLCVYALHTAATKVISTLTPCGHKRGQVELNHFPGICVPTPLSRLGLPVRNQYAMPSSVPTRWRGEGREEARGITPDMRLFLHQLFGFILSDFIVGVSARASPSDSFRYLHPHCSLLHAPETIGLSF